MFNKLHADGLGRQIKQTEILTTKDEQLLWQSGVVNTTTPRGLLNAAFYVVGKMFCLRGGQEHRFLKLSQIKRTDDKYTYYENVSKNRNGSYKQLHVRSKTVPLYPNPDLGDRCPVLILDKYISKLPQSARDKDIFYARPLEKMPTDENAPWYSPVPIGKHTLQTMVKRMCKEANIKGAKTNHSLRATAATQMFAQGAPEKVIQERTGHRSLDGLRTYERSSESQHRALSTLLSTNLMDAQKESSHCTTNMSHSSTKLGQSTTNLFSQSSKSIENVPSMNFSNCSVTVNIQGNSNATCADYSYYSSYYWPPYMYGPGGYNSYFHPE